MYSMSVLQIWAKGEDRVPARRMMAINSALLSPAGPNLISFSLGRSATDKSLMFDNSVSML
jgi:hypothetical protein